MKWSVASLPDTRPSTSTLDTELAYQEATLADSSGWLEPLMSLISFGVAIDRVKSIVRWNLDKE